MRVPGGQAVHRERLDQESSRSATHDSLPDTVIRDVTASVARVRGVVRAHQHVAALNPLMSRLVACDGVFRHWQEKESTADAKKSVDEIRRHLRPEETRSIPEGSVWTFNVAPDSAYGVACRCDFVTMGLLKLAPAFKDWRMSVVRINVF